MNDLPDDLADFDETFGEIELDELPPVHRTLLLRQRLAHGLLSAARVQHEVGRERFVQQVLGRIAGLGQVVDDPALDVVDATADELRGDDDESLEPGVLRDEMLRQRVVHGLLRADAARNDRVGRHALIDSIARRVTEPQPPAAPSPVPPAAHPLHWRRYVIAAAIVALAGVAIGILSERPGRHPMLAAATRAIARDAHRHFRLTVERIDSVPAYVVGTHDIWLHTGATGAPRFRVTVRGQQTGRQEIGSDGSEVWRLNLDDESDREVVGPGSVNELFARLVKLPGLGPGLDCVRAIDVAGLFDVLSGETTLELGAAPIPVAEGRVLQMFHGSGMLHPDIGEMSAILVVLTAADQSLEVLEFVRTMPEVLLRYRFESQGVGEQRDEFYRRPW